jgi:hypothetical protein
MHIDQISTSAVTEPLLRELTELVGSTFTDPIAAFGEYIRRPGTVYLGRAAGGQAVSVFFVPAPEALVLADGTIVQTVRFGLSAVHASTPRIGYSVPLYAAAVGYVANLELASGLPHHIWGLAGQPVIMHAVWRHLSAASPGRDGSTSAQATAIAEALVERYALDVIGGDPFRVSNSRSGVRLRDTEVTRIESGLGNALFNGLDYHTCDAILYVARVSDKLPNHHIRRAGMEGDAVA